MLQNTNLLMIFYRVWRVTLVLRRGFFLWIKVQDSEKTTLDLWRETGVRVLPGAYLAQEKNGRNPGQNFIRVALVAQQKITERR